MHGDVHFTRLGGCKLGGVETEKDRPPIDHYPRFPFSAMFMPRDSQVPARECSLAVMTVLLILRRRHRTKVGAQIVETISVDVISDLSRGKRPPEFARKDHSMHSLWPPPPIWLMNIPLGIKCL